MVLLDVQRLDHRLDAAVPAEAGELHKGRGLLLRGGWDGGLRTEGDRSRGGFRAGKGLRQAKELTVYLIIIFQAAVSAVLSRDHILSDDETDVIVTRFISALEEDHDGPPALLRVVIRRFVFKGLIHLPQPLHLLRVGDMSGVSDVGAKHLTDGGGSGNTSRPAL